ncbi:MAG: methyltransferase domain-containing protein [Actinomycetia bacterium]|nr:methyltransferase domain-containing protein [Actinomycetes bacterium]MCP5031253.1 methyltransferase domain-containing protein [Actinomycetes bacterium]
MAWDPAQYLQFADHRTRPGLELLARLPNNDPKRIVDLGSGTGHLTALLAERWPEAEVVGVDSSSEMQARARAEHPSLVWQQDNISTWASDEPIDLIFSNAALHWLEDHQALLTHLRSQLAPGGVLAVQMPDNWAAPTHQIPAEILDDGTWSDDVRQSLMRDRLSEVGAYRRWLEPATVDLWRTTYYQALDGPDPVWNWVIGSVLSPVLAALDGADRNRFVEQAKGRYRQAYPADAEGITILPFSRLFIIAHLS